LPAAHNIAVLVRRTAGEEVNIVPALSDEVDKDKSPAGWGVAKPNMLVIPRSS
jgi:hypothetical protein